MKYKKEVYVSVDVESNGPLIGINSIVCFGAVAIAEDKGILSLGEKFLANLAPLTDEYIPEALAVSGYTFDETTKFPKPEQSIKEFVEWCNKISNNGANRLVLISDNNGYDASWINYYTIRFNGKNPFGWSSRRIGDLFCGSNKNLKFGWKKYRKTMHDHNPLNDAIGNAEAFIYLINKEKFRL